MFNLVLLSNEVPLGVSVPEVRWEEPDETGSVALGQEMQLQISAPDALRVEFFVDGRWLGSDESAPFAWAWTPQEMGSVVLSARAVSADGIEGRPENLELEVVPSAGTGALFFDGVDDRVVFEEDERFGLKTWTLEAWVRWSGEGSVASSGSGGVTAIPLVAKGRGEADGSEVDCNYFFGIRPEDGVLVADFEDMATGGNHPVSGSTSLPPNVWVHVAATMDGEKWRLYVDGQLDGEAEVVGQLPRWDSIHRTSLGVALNSIGGSLGAFHGQLDEVRIWSRALSRRELVTGVWAIPEADDSLVGRWTFAEGGGLETWSDRGILGSLLGVPRWSDGLELPGNGWPYVELEAPREEERVEVSGVRLAAVGTDPEGHDVNLKYYLRRRGWVTPGEDFRVIAIPDTQFYSGELNGGTAAMFSSQTDWIVARRVPDRIRFVMHLGDVTQNGETYPVQWLNASQAMYRLEDPTTTLLSEGIPYGVTVGNHDQTPIGDADGLTTSFNEYFGTAHFEGKSYYGGGWMPGNADNNYQFFSGGGIDFVVVNVEYDTSPDAEVLDWVDGILAANPDRRAIVVSHWMVNTGNPASFSTLGQALYDRLKLRPNLMLMHGGHIHGEGLRTDLWEGRAVHSILADYQGRNHGGDGWLRILEFSPRNNEVRVKTYSATLDEYESDADSEFVLPVDLSGALGGFAEVGVVSGSGSGNRAEVAVEGLEPGAVYEWYVEASDGNHTTRSDVQTWVTAGGGAAPEVSLLSPTNGSRFGSPASVHLEASAVDADGSVERVDFFRGTEWLGSDASAPFTWDLESPELGSYVLLAKAIDDQGNVTTSSPVSVVVNPTVTVVAERDRVGEFGDRSMAFRIERMGGMAEGLEVKLSASGSAKAGEDVTGFSPAVTLGAEQAFERLPMEVVEDELSEGEEIFRVSVAADLTYVLGQPSSAEVTIDDRPWQEFLFQRLKGSLRDPAEDADGDGRTNLMEYFQASDPALSSEVGLWEARREDGVFRVRYERGLQRVDVEGLLEWSVSGRDWMGSGDSDGERTIEAQESVIGVTKEGRETVEALMVVKAGMPPEKLFVRLRVEER
nr:Ig-like domain-containing protein [Haloferula luteola]